MLWLPHALQRQLAQGVLQGPVVLVPVRAALPWQATAQAPARWAPFHPQASAHASAGFSGPRGAVVGLHLSYYRQQDYQRKLVSSGNSLVHRQDSADTTDTTAGTADTTAGTAGAGSNPPWAQVSSGQASVSLGGRSLVLPTATLRQSADGLTGAAQRLQVWRWYWVHDRFVASDVQAKLHGALSLLGGRGDDGAIVVVYTPLNPQLPEAQARAAADAVLRAFVDAHGTALAAALDHSRGGH